MRKINYIMVHCTASPSTWGVADLRNCFKMKGWSAPGYHYAVTHDGTIHELLDVSFIANGCRGYNQNSIHVAWVGGQHGIDNRTPQQEKALYKIVADLKNTFPNAKIIGHNEVSNKLCPCFNCATEFAKLQSK